MNAATGKKQTPLCFLGLFLYILVFISQAPALPTPPPSPPPPTSDYYNITTNPGSNGGISCSPSVVSYDGSSTCTITPTAGYQVEDVSVGPTGGSSSSLGAVTLYTINNITAHITVSATFALSPVGANPIARFWWMADPGLNYNVLFDASSSTCPAGVSCSYSWIFGDGSAAGTGVTTSHAFVSAATTTVTLTIDANGAIDSYSLVVLPRPIPTPVVVNAPTVSINGLMATVTDNSSGGDDPITVLVNWGDGMSDLANGHGAVLTHSYATAKTYAAKITVSGSTGSAYVNFSVVVTPLTVSGVVYKKDGITPISGVLVTLKVGTAGKYIVSTDATGHYTVPNVAAATYTVIPSKSGYTFNPATVTVTNVNMTQNFSATNL